jgi:hypothetical protein
VSVAILTEFLFCTVTMATALAVDALPMLGRT